MSENTLKDDLYSLHDQYDLSPDELKKCSQDSFSIPHQITCQCLKCRCCECLRLSRKLYFVVLRSSLLNQEHKEIGTLCAECLWDLFYQCFYCSIDGPNSKEIFHLRK